MKNVSFRRLLFAVVIMTIMIVDGSDCCLENVVTFNVKHKFVGKREDLNAMKAHDIRRHARFLSTINVDIPLGGDGQAAGDGLYFAKLEIGNPVENYHVSIDTASDIMWVNCVGCDKCPNKTNIDIELRQYDPKKSSTSNLVYCNNEFCSGSNNGEFSYCKPDQKCEYNIRYADNDSSVGYFVKDVVQLQQVTGNFQTGATNGTIIFGCGTAYGNKKSDYEVDGLIGFGQANTSVISQLAASGKVRRKFAHCLDNVDGGGIFAIGEVVAPQIKKTRMIQDKSHYKVQLKEIQVGDTIIKLSTTSFGSEDENGLVIDTGSTLSYLPTKIYEQVTQMIKSRISSKTEKKYGSYTCFKYDKNVDDEFPIIRFHFTDSLVLAVYPRDYLFKAGKDTRCIGWMDSGEKDVKLVQDGLLLLGDFALSNKLVIYDLENQTIGWTEYNCTSGIKLKE